jgi:hypothetical protein
MERWWRVTVQGYPDWIANEGEAKTARRNGYEVVGPFVLEAERPSGAVEALREYGRHRSDCNVTMARRGYEIGAECTCGFDAALGGQ